MKRVIKSSTVNTAFTIDYDIEEIAIGERITKGNKNTGELKISPRIGYIINADNFSTGLLPKNVINVFFRNDSPKIDINNKVRVQVVLAQDVTMGHESLIYDIPISGFGTLPSNTVELTCESKQHTDVMTSISTSDDKIVISQPVVNNDITSTKYTAVGKPGITIVILQKIFSSVTGFYFPVSPTYKLTTRHKSRYNIEVFSKYDSERRLVGKTFTVKYTFPEGDVLSNDTISFDASTMPIAIKRTDPGYFSSKTPEIYSVDTGSPVGPLGGVRNVIVKGTPGAPFKVVIQNAAKQIYDLEKGAFVTGGRPIEGVIPQNQIGGPIGQYKAFIRIPPLTENNSNAALNNFVETPADGDSVQTRLITDEEVKTSIETDKPSIIIGGEEIIERGATVDNTTIAQKAFGVIKFYGAATNFTVSNNKLKWLNTLDGFKIVEDLELSDVYHKVGPGSFKDRSDIVYNFEYRVAPADSLADTFGIRVIRQPKFVMWDGVADSATAYRTWACDGGGSDCSDANTKLLDTNGKTITSDWYVADNNNNVYNVQAKVVPTPGTFLKNAAKSDYSSDADAYDYYRSVTITGSVSGIIFGQKTTLVKLDFLNFLQLTNTA